MDDSLESDPQSLEHSLDQNLAESGSKSTIHKPRFPRPPKYVLLALIVIVVIAVITGGIMLSKKSATPAKKAPTPITINTQNLDNGTLNKLTAQSGAAPGETKQQLTIAPDTLFKQSVSVQGALSTQGNVDIGGNLAIKGTSTFQGAVGMNSNLAVRGTLSVGGVLSAPSLNVGTLAITTINISGALNFAGHIVPGGAQPTARTSVAAAGGNIVITGNDTSGTITLTTAGGPTAAGELAIVTFRNAFSGTPKVQLTPINAPASGLNYYATRSADFFTLNTSSPTTSGTSYIFDYLVTQ